LRNDESLDAEALYIRENPIRAGLLKIGENWPFVLTTDDIETLAQHSRIAGD
jgi:hypothetical protein